MRLTDEGRLALARLAGYYGISQSAVVEMVVRETDRRLGMTAPLVSLDYVSGMGRIRRRVGGVTRHDSTATMQRL